ncbi:MAG: aminotransferase class I/II-fold pyridoxal phosphate-dependent enzyme, partial [Chloroflexi bacterium]
MRLEYIRSSTLPFFPVRPDVPSLDPSHSIRDGMEMRPISRKMDALLAAHQQLLEFFEWFSARGTRAGIADFVAGNPQEMPLPEYVAAIKKWSEPRRKDWFAYHMNVPEARRAIVASLSEHRGIRFAAEDIALTTGAFAGLEVAMRAVCDEGDEVIYLTPPWFFYDGIAKGLGLLPVKVRVDMTTFDIDVPAVERAITARTRAIIVNSPNNPTGKAYPRATLDRLAAVLEAASERNGRAIYLLSDEAYCRILYDGRHYESPTESYPRSILIYTYGKQLLTPGERIGYLALPPTMP